MRSYCITLLFIILGFTSGASAHSLREEFHGNELNRENVERILSQYKTENSTVDKAYLGVYQAIMAQYVFLPTSKLKSFYDGRDLLDASIEENKDNGEIRYLRLLIQLNAPSFLFYNKNINDDLAVFIKDVNNQNIDPYWSNIFISNLLKGKKLAPKQIEELTQLKNTLVCQNP